jgi:L-ribulokinase
VRCADGVEFGAAVASYTSGKHGVIINPRDHNMARQHPGDLLSSMERCAKEALEQAARKKGFHNSLIVGLGVDTTGSSPIPVNSANRALSSLPKWKKNPAAQCWLWKDHTSWQEAARITELAAKHRPEYIAKCGNTYSSEWFWSKIWHCLKTAPDVFQAAYSWVEMCDWIPAVLCGVEDPQQIKRGICAAGHKALYCEEWGGLPDKKFLSLLSPKLAELRDRLYDKAHDANTTAGTLSPTWAKTLGLPVGIPVAIGEMDVHYGAIGSGIREGTLVKVIGTSTCDCAVVSATKRVKDIPGICGIVKGAILPGFFGIEAGQSAVGDIFKWWIESVCEGSDALYASLAKEAATLEPGGNGLLALDWNNGNRTVLVDPMLSGLLLGTTLHTTKAEIYRALIEATAFGSRTIIERIEAYGVPVKRIVCAGGIAEKNPLLMQIYADVTGRTMLVAGSSQACALGSAVSAAVLAGVFKDFPAAQKAMTSLKDIEYKPRPAARKTYNRLFALYQNLHDSFGGVNRKADLSGGMKELLAIKSKFHK